MTSNLPSGSDAAPTTNGRTEPSAHDPSLLAIANVVLRHRRLMFVLPLACVLIAVVISRLKPVTYTSSAAFIPQSADGLRGSALAGVAAEFGVAVPGSQPTESPVFYAELVTTRDILKALADQEYNLQNGDRRIRGPLAELVDIKGKAPAQREEGTIRYLRKAVSVSTSRETGIVRVSTTTIAPDLAKELVSHLIAHINEFNLERRQSQAKAERTFIEERLRDAKQQVKAAEDRLQSFLQQNRQFRNSPELTFEHERFEREVEMRHALFTALSENYERARIDEVRNIPVVTVLEQPSLPARANGRGTTVRSLTGLCLGLLIALIVAFALEYYRRSRGTAVDDYEQFEILRRQAVQDVLRPFNKLRRIPAGTGHPGSSK